MRNPDKESYKSPAKQKVVPISSTIKKKKQQYHVYTFIIAVFTTSIFYLFKSDDDTGILTKEKGLNFNSAKIGEKIKIGKSIMENNDIVHDLNIQEENQRRLSHTSFDWFYNDTITHKEKTYKNENDADKLKETLENTNAFLNSLNKEKLQGEKYTSYQNKSNKSVSTSYTEKRKAELNDLKAEQLKLLNEILNANRKQENTTPIEEKKEKHSQPQVKVLSDKRSEGFYSLKDENNSLHSNNVSAVVHGNYKNVRAGSEIKFRILDDIQVGEYIIQKGTFVYGILSFANNRANIYIENINKGSHIIPFNGSIYDKDGFEGLSLPYNLTNNTTREAGSQAITSTNTRVNFSTPMSSINSGVNAVGSAIKSAVSGTVKENKISISTNYKVLIRFSE